MIKEKGLLILFLFFCKFSFTQIDHWETVVYENDSWNYFVGTTSPPANWYSPVFNPVAWNTGTGGFGYGDNDDNTVTPTTLSVFTRRDFNLIDTSLIESALLNVDYDDAFVAYINGIEIARDNIGSAGTPVAYNDLAISNHEALMYQGGAPSSFFISKQILNNIISNGLNSLSVQANNLTAGSTDLSCRVWLSLAIIDTSSNYGPLPPWFMLPLVFESSDLPIVVINTNGQSIPDEPKINGEIGIIWNGPGVRNYLTDGFNHLNVNIGIEMRGSSSQTFPKKPYSIELRDTAGIPVDFSVLGMPLESDWILGPSYADKSLMRNPLSYYLWNEMGHYATRGRYVEVMLNGIYKGVYFLCEKVKQDADRVAISDMDSTDISGDALTGGYILKVDKLTGNSQNYWGSLYPPAYVPAGDHPNIVVHSPSDLDLVQQQYDYIHSYVDSFELALNSPAFTDSISGYPHFIDIPSWVDYFIMTEFNKNLDAFRSSNFFYKDRLSEGGKLVMGPVWDYDLAYGNANFCETWMFTGWGYRFNNICPNDSWLAPFWWKRLLEDPDFVQRIRCRWEEIKTTVLEPQHVYEWIDSTAALLDESKERNFETWPILGLFVWPNYYVPADYEGEVDTLKWWIQERFNWLDNNLPGDPLLCSVKNYDPNWIWKGFEIFPNPFEGEFTLRFTGLDSMKFFVSLSNIFGQKVIDALEFNVRLGENELLIHPEKELSQGIYLLKAEWGEVSWTWKVVK